MKRFLPLLLAAIVALVGCKKEAPADPELKLTSPATITIGADGGSSVISFVVTNPVKGIEPTATSSASWVTIDEVGADLVALTIAANDQTSPRTAEVTLSYANQQQSVTINQSACEFDITMEAQYFSGLYNGTRYSESHNYYVGLAEAIDADGYIAPNSRLYFIDIYANEPAEGDLTLPAGSYTLDPENSYAVGTISALYSYWSVTDENGQHISGYNDIYLTEAQMVVTAEGITLELTDELGKTHRVTYTGPMECVDDSAVSNSMSTLTEDFVADLTDARMVAEYHHNFYCDWEANWLLFIAPNSGTGDYFTFDIVTDTLSMERGIDDIYTGALTFRAHNFVPGKMQNWGSWYYYVDAGSFPEDGAKAPLMTGTLEIIKNDNGTHTVNIDCYDDCPEPNRITATWTGVVEVVDRSGQGDAYDTQQPTPPLRAAENRHPQSLSPQGGDLRGAAHPSAPDAIKRKPLL